MPPKRAAGQKAVLTSPEGSESNDNDLEKAGSDAVDSVATVKVAAHPPALVMVQEALRELDSRKGVSSQAIRNSIKLKYPTLDSDRLKLMVRRALIKGLENGSLVRPAKAAAAVTGAQGSFRLAPKKDAKPKTENADPNVEKPKAGPKKANAADKESGTGKKNDSKKKGGSTGTVKKTKDAMASKVAPAKRPKAKEAAVNMEASEDADGEPKAKEPKAKEAKIEEAGAKEPKATAKEPKAKAKEPKAKEAKIEEAGAKEPKATAKEPKAKEPKAKAKEPKAKAKEPKAKAKEPKAVLL